METVDPDSRPRTFQTQFRRDGFILPPPYISTYPEWSHKNLDEFNNGIAPPNDDFFKLRVLQLLKSIEINTYNSALPVLSRPRVPSIKPEVPDTGIPMERTDDLSGEQLQQGGRRKTRRQRKTRRSRN